MDFTILCVNYRNRFTPVTLTSKNPFTEMIIYCLSGNALLYKLIGNGFLGLFYRKTGKLRPLQYIGILFGTIRHNRSGHRS